MDNVIKAILLQDVRVESDWASDSTTIIPEGKQCFSSDKGNAYKVGDGKHKWSELSYNSAIASDVPSWAKSSTKPTYTKAEVGLGNVENKSSSTIRGEITKDNVTKALGYTPPTTNTTYSTFTGATSSANGTIGLVPASKAGDNTNKYLKADGTWAVPPDTNTTYNVATPSANGLMSSADKSKLDGIASGANNYKHPAYTAKSSGLYKITVDATGHVSAVSKVTKSDITALGIPGQDTNTTYNDMTGATTDANGTSGLVPAPEKGDNSRYLRSDGTWVTPPNTTYNIASTSSNGLMSSSDKSKLDGIASGANKYIHPSYTAKSSGLYKITVDSSGHVSTVSTVTKSDITSLGIPSSDTTYNDMTGATASANGTHGLVPAPAKGDNSNKYLKADGTWSIPPNTTYNVASTTAKGLMSSADKSKLDGIASGANKYTHPSYTAKASGLYKVTVDGTGHVSAVTAVTKADITALGIPGQDTNTTYSEAGSSLGLVKSGGNVTISSGVITVTDDGHKHSNSSITSLDASKLTGTIDIARLPKGALERCIVVANDEARFALATTDAQTGDTVKVSSTGKMYFIVDDSKLSSEDGYEVYTAGSATSVPWSGVTGKPSKFTPSSHKHTISDISNISSASVASATKATQDASGNTIASTYIKGLSVSGRTITYTKGDNTTGTITTQDTTYESMTGATASANGKTGLVPVPTKGASNRYLRSDGTWAVPPDTNTTYNVASTSSNGLMSSADKSKLDGIASGANNYTHPAYTAKSSGLYKITVDATGHVSAVTAVTKSDITALGIPGQDTNTTYNDMTGATASADGTHGLVPAPAKGDNSRYLRSDGTWVTPPNTTYNIASTSSNGLMSSSDKSKLDGIASGANKYIHPSYTAKASGLYKITVDGSGHVSEVTAVTKSDITALGIPGQDTNTTYNDMTGATTDANGTHGLVPAPEKGDNSRYLRSDGTWAVPPDTNTWRPLGTGADQACAGNDSRLSNARPASDVYSWAKAASKPSYTKSEVGLGNVDNTADANKSVKYATSAGSANKASSASSADTALALTKSKTIYDAIYPVGIILPFANTTDPNTVFTGTTWTKTALGKTLVGAGTYSDGTTSKTFAVGDTGGKYKVALATGNLPSHSHSISLEVRREAIKIGSGSTTGYIPARGNQSTSTYLNTGTTGSTGSGTAFEVLTPYQTVVFWQRTA